MPDNADISVVIPVYNNPDAAARAVASVLQQTRPAHEIILVDDGSDAASVAQLEHALSLCRSDVSICLERLSANVGPAGARHAGANVATGSHVAFLDADDLWHRAKIGMTKEAIDRYGAELIGHARPWSFDVSEEALTTLPAGTPVTRLSRRSFLRRNPIPTSSIVARRSIAREMFRYGGRKAEDYMALVVASKMTRQIFYIGADLCWALKPPFGYSGAGADQIRIYHDSAAHMVTLYREKVISMGELALYAVFLAARAPIGLIRHGRYRRLYGRQEPKRG